MTDISFSVCRFQSTLPRRERPNAVCTFFNERHFNPRSREGSDNNHLHKPLPQRISIHAPAKGATAIMSTSAATIDNFNPRSREGSDYVLRMHASRLWNFNPRSREGSDVRLSRYSRGFCKSISIHAPAKGATREISLLMPRPVHFNPRSREGSDDRAGQSWRTAC